VTPLPSNSKYGGAEDDLVIVRLVGNVIDCREGVLNEVVLGNERSVCPISHTTSAKKSHATLHIAAP